MSEEIKEIDMHKYYVLKGEDIKKYLSFEEREELRDIYFKIYSRREQEGKKENQYLVLNMDDEMYIKYLENLFGEIRKEFRRLHQPEGEHKVTVRDIAVDLVNAILRAKK